MTVTTYRAAIVVLLIAVAALATVAGIVLSRPSAPGAPASATDVTVSSFNDGFSDSKADDCEQGFAAACAWLKSN